ncbi:hypothetical protein A2856_00100 [Candidatus Uhrbacteria bacterium RIFCSPHIGHO2_01_FULL_63_20]|uniref:Uncharacterized protein n=1 Tax=Candidatus Uhrbacteria bacterium RIFCSPHIGHO2_01_FULL_63_20 TaxID=1802385 RepID=A0A1F7TLN4_9BACT|nr:MAG: hypothetical protein A2856_00100 [Candidatus Uhrbacteria bacterium RIFCSPHIGHO2_01_FULL_63_20]
MDAATKGSEPIAQVASTALVSLFIPLSISWRNPAILFMHHSPGLFVKRDGQEVTAASQSSNPLIDDIPFYLAILNATLAAQMIRRSVPVMCPGLDARASSNTFLKFRLSRVDPILKLSRARDWEQSREESATAATTGHICM